MSLVSAAVGKGERRGEKRRRGGRKQKEGEEMGLELHTWTRVSPAAPQGFLFPFPALEEGKATVLKIHQFNDYTTEGAATQYNTVSATPTTHRDFSHCVDLNPCLYGCLSLLFFD